MEHFRPPKRPVPVPPIDFVQWYDKKLSEHVSLRDAYVKEGYRFLSLSIYGPFYAAVMIRRRSPYPPFFSQHDYPNLNAQSIQQAISNESAQGYGPAIIAATGPADNPVFALVFEPQDQQNPPVLPIQWDLTSGSNEFTNTIQGMNAYAKHQQYMLSCAAAYGDPTDPRFAGIWVPNPDRVMWNADGVSDSGDDYESRLDAQTSQWCRPAFVTVNSSSNSPSLQYLSVFVDTEVGSWYEKHGLTAGDYQRELGNASAQGFFPVCLQGAFSLTWEGGVPSGESPPPYPTPPSRPIPVSETYLSAIFAKSLVTVQKQFTATGPVANADIDNVIMQAMQNGGPQGGGPVRHASLAIVHGTQLVYARGYTWAEPDWPVVQPTTCFRLASVSKTPTALAIYKLIEDGMLNSDGSDKVQDILNLETPGGGSPTDPYFNDITIKNLLEHRNGLDQIPYSNGIPVQQAFQQAGKKVSLPVTADETDSYIASKTLNPDTSPPGTNQAYSNCGYYLLARVVAKLRNPLAWPLSRPIDAYQESLFNPLNITRIRRGRSLVVDQLPDEARYQDPDLPLGQSQMSDSEPLVPSQYGADYQKEIDEGAGGLSAAATDLARLVAILISQNNNPQPIIQRATIISMLTSGATLWTLVNNGTVKNVENPQNTRAGYGFDEVHASPYNPHNLGTLGSGQFYGQKGGEITAAQTVLQFDGDWGFVMLWAGKAPKPDWGVWYPDYQAVISIAQQVQWSQDLFSGYGMPPLL